MNLVFRFSHKFGPIAKNVFDTKKTNEVALIGPVHQLTKLSIFQ
jgi:hypothetical protein